MAMEEEQGVDKRLIDSYRMGQEAETFWHSEIGQKILSMIEGELSEFKNELCGVDPENSKEIRRIQNEILVLNKIQGYFADLITAGMDAKIIIDSEEG